MTDRDDTNDWMAALSGKKPAHDDNTRSAARLRDALLPTKDEQDAAPMDDASLRRMMNLLEAKGAFDEASPAPTPSRAGDAAGSWLAKIKSLLLGDQGWGQLGYAAVAMIVVVVMVVPGLKQEKAAHIDNEAPYTKQAPADALQRIHAANPANAAAQLSQALRRRGLSPAVSALAHGQAVQVSVPAAQRVEVEQVLMELGLSLPEDGQLNVEFVPVGIGPDGAKP